MRSAPAAPPGEHEVEIGVAATALNFRDIMVTLDMLPMASYERSALGREVGIEASGTVRRTGSAVTSVKPGQKVIFMAGGCVASSVTVNENAVSSPLSRAVHAAGGRRAVGLRHGLLRPGRPRPATARPAGAHPLRHGRRQYQAAIALARRARRGHLRDRRDGRQAGQAPRGSARPPRSTRIASAGTTG